MQAVAVDIPDFSQGPSHITAAIPGVLSPLLGLTNEAQQIPRDSAGLLSTGHFRYNSTLSLSSAGAGLYQALSLTASVKFSATHRSARASVGPPVYARPMVNAALAEMGDGVPENREVTPATIARYAFPLAREADYMRVLRPLMQRARTGSSHGLTLFKMSLYVLQAQLAEAGVLKVAPSCRAGNVELIHITSPSVESAAMIYRYDGKRVVSAGALPNDAGFGGFVAAATAPFVPLAGSGDRIARITLPGDNQVYVLWSAANPDMAATDWASSETLAQYMATYAQSVGATDTMRLAMSTALLVPWAIERGHPHVLDDVFDNIRVPDSRHHADLLPHVIKAPSSGSGFEAQVGLTEVLPYLAARVQMCAHSAAQQTLWHLGALWSPGGDGPMLAERVTSYCAPDHKAASFASMAFGNTFDLNPGWSAHWGPVATVEEVCRDISSRGLPSSVATRCTLPFQRAAYAPLNIAGHGTPTLPLRFYAQKPVINAADRLVCELAARFGVGEVVLFNPNPVPGLARLASRPYVNQAVHYDSRVSGVQLADPRADCADVLGRRKAAWAVDATGPRTIGSWMRARELVTTGTLYWAGCGYSPPDESDLVVAQVGGDDNACEDDFAWTRSLPAHAPGYVTMGPIADPPPPPQVMEAQTADFGTAHAMVDPALVGAPIVGGQVAPAAADPGIPEDVPAGAPPLPPDLALGALA